jgi:hypothetical protein
MPKKAMTHSSLAAAWLLIGRELLPDAVNWPHTVEEILAITRSSKSQAYFVKGRLEQTLENIWLKPGRPVAAQPSENSLLRVSLAVQKYLWEQPGCAYRVQQRLQYSEEFRHFILDLREPGKVAHGLSLEQLASVTFIPLPTLKDWFCAPRSKPSPPAVRPSLADKLRDQNLRQIATLWLSWHGTFQAFCVMLRDQQRLPYGDTFIGNFLQRAGLRQRKKQEPTEAPWSSNTFRAFFPGAQWLGDGTAIHIGWGTGDFVFNLEAILDVGSNALVGFGLSDFENEEVVIQAFLDGVASAGKPPLALSLDNRNSNHSPAVVAAAASTEPPTDLLRSTLGRGQAKAPLEGAFGLLEQSLPPLQIHEDQPREMARQALRLILTAWARGRNGRPRRRLGMKSPAELYGSYQACDQEIEEAKQWIQELKRRQDLSRRTREERRDPIKLALLQQGLTDLGISDADGHLAFQLAYYSLNAIADGLAIFEAKLLQKILPDGADPGRYLGGIIRNQHDRLEQEALVELFLKQRLRLRDLSLQALNLKAKEIRAELPRTSRPLAFALESLSAARSIDQHFWARKSCRALTALPPSIRNATYNLVARKVASSYKNDRRRRESLIERLARFAG